MPHDDFAGGSFRRRALRVAAFPLALLIVGGCAALDAFLIEPFSVQLTRDAIQLPVRSPLTIAHLTDLHTHGFGRRERRVVELLAESRPDLIVVTGDTVDGDSLEPARELFTHLTAPLGIWVVRGNRENWRHLRKAPEAFDELRNPVNLAFAGHTHGGQVRFPFVPPWWLPAGSGRSVEGWYQVGAARMFVSRGIGTSILPVRFFCRPQVEVVSVTPGG